jgi:hypothetical protein
MVMIEQSLIVAYTMVLVTKTCELSSDVCVTYGFGETGKGVQSTYHSPSFELSTRYGDRQVSFCSSSSLLLAWSCFCLPLPSYAFTTPALCRSSS